MNSALFGTTRSAAEPVNSIEEETRTMDLLRKKNPNVAEELITIVTALKRRQLVGSFDVALQTCKLYRNILSTVFFETIDHYISLIRSVARILLAAQPIEVVSGCMARRVLSIMRDYAKTVALASTSPDAAEDLVEAGATYAAKVAEMREQAVQQGGDQTDSKEADENASTMPMNDILNPEPRTVLSAVQYRPIRPSILDDINTELIESLEADRRAPRAADYAEDHIHNKQVIFTYGFSHTVLHFLKVAAWGQNYQKKLRDPVPKKKRDFEVCFAYFAAGCDRCICCSTICPSVLLSGDSWWAGNVLGCCVWACSCAWGAPHGPASCSDWYPDDGRTGCIHVYDHGTCPQSYHWYTRNHGQRWTNRIVGCSASCPRGKSL